MSSFRTFFRVVVMLAALGLVAKAWYHYGLTLGELQAIGSRGVEVASELWEKYWQSPGTSSALAVDDQRQSTIATPPAPFVPPTGPVEPMRLPATTTAPGDALPVQLAAGSTAQTAAAEMLPPSPAALPGGILSAATLSTSDPPPADPLQAMVERLNQLGARDQQLTPWGSRGELVRFTCSVPWGGSATFTRQFEAVATTPLAAVEQVTAEIEAWHGSR